MGELALAVLTRKVQTLKTDIEADRNRLFRQEMKLEVLEEALKEIEAATNVRADSRDPGNGYIPGRGMKPSQAVIDLLMNHPNRSVHQILDALEDRVDTTAKNVRHNIRTTIFNMEKSGKITKNQDGTLRVTT